MTYQMMLMRDVATLDSACEKEPGPGAICNWMTVPKWLGTTILNV